tara:strand:- start:554 stop:1447 length:894 start_codon:yes stop_codon:yes gene_type:complete
MRDRRRKKDEPFNPFQANAKAVRQKKRSERNPGHVNRLREKIRRLESELIVSIFPPWVFKNSVGKKRNERTQQQGTSSSTPVRPAHRTQNLESDLLKKQKEAREKLTVSEKQISSQITPTVESNQINTAAPQSTSKNQSRADRLAELRKQSQESIKKTESILEPANHRPLEMESDNADQSNDSSSSKQELPLTPPTSNDLESDLLKKQKEARENLTVSEKQISSEIKSAEREKNRSPPKPRKMSKKERQEREKAMKIRNLKGQINSLNISKSSKKGRQRAEAEKKIKNLEKDLENLR